MPALTQTALPTSTPLPATTLTPTTIPNDLTYEQAVHLFDYSIDIPFEIKEISVTRDEDGVTVYDILYTAHNPEYGSGKGGPQRISSARKGMVHLRVFYSCTGLVAA